MSLCFWWNLKITGLKDQVTYYLGKRVSNLNIMAVGGSNLGCSECGNLLAIWVTLHEPRRSELVTDIVRGNNSLSATGELGT